ncbi:MAG: disulfide bond formation protein B [Candidatus Pelagibacter sp.]
MNIFLNKKNFYLFIIFYSFFAIFFALYVEYILGYKPCKLCVYQRVPYIAAIFVSFVGYNYFKNIRILILIIIIFTISALISGYHYGIENSIFEEFSGCTSNTLNIFDKSKLLQSLNNNFTSCKDVNFKLFGISLAGINLFLSLLIVIYSLRTIVYEKN